VASNIAYYEAILKEKYAPVIARQVWRKTVLLQELEKTTDFVDVSGRYYYVPLELGLNEGIGAGGEYDELPIPTNEITGGARYYSTQQTAVVQLSLRALQGGRGPEAVWRDLESFKFESVTRNLRMDINRQLFGDGSGVLTTVSGISEASGNTTVTVDNAKYIRKGMNVDFINHSTGAKIVTKEVVSVNYTNNTFVVSGTGLGLSNGNYVTRKGAYNKECDGLKKIVAASGAVGGVDPATPGYHEWAAAYVRENAGTFGFDTFERPIREIRLRGGTVDLIIASPGVVSAAANYLESFKRIPVQTESIILPGGFEAVKWNVGNAQGVALAEDPDCPPGTAYFLALELRAGDRGDDERAIVFGQLADPGWVDLGEGILKWDGDRTYKAIWVWDMNLITLHRNLTAKVSGITEV
jgi:hypothetical protein